MHLLSIGLQAAVEPVTTTPDAGIYATLIPLLVLLPILGFAFTAFKLHIGRQIRVLQLEVVDQHTENMRRIF